MGVMNLVASLVVFWVLNRNFYFLFTTIQSIYSATTWCRDQYHRRKKSVAEESKKKLVGRPPKQEISESPSGNKQRGPGIPKKMARREEICKMTTVTNQREEVCEDVEVEETIVTTHLQLLLTINLYPKIEIQSFLNRRLALCITVKMLDHQLSIIRTSNDLTLKKKN
ncbi:hypothetical protein BpHYR1_033643 [Brachionus plicatilis]|uniref:Uncharacterized protein n=1 Tax=Brachionus plicatilis TaxID=10195 RepID=A0A3M7QCB5_BRAPC|nr:hypothetical protein BpHYR1_033643 [Brachionus plicatilis]